MNRSLGLSVSFALVISCGSTLDLGSRRDADAGSPVVDGGSSSDGVPESDGSTVADGGPATCGRGTAKSTCRVFLTAARPAADFGGLVGGDARCAAAAEGAGVAGRFKAYLSDGVIAAWSRFESDGPWSLLGSNEALFSDRTQLKVEGRYPLDRNERGELLDIPGHWTGVREQGFAGEACAGFTSRAKSLMGSFGDTAPSRWLFQASVTCDGDVGFHLLCLED